MVNYADVTIQQDRDVALRRLLSGLLYGTLTFHSFIIHHIVQVHTVILSFTNTCVVYRHL